MNISRRKGKKQLCKNHRLTWYEKKLDELFDGKTQPEQVSLRWNKYKEVK